MFEQPRELPQLRAEERKHATAADEAGDPIETALANVCSERNTNWRETASRRAATASVSVAGRNVTSRPA